MLISLLLILADNRFNYLNQVRYYASYLVAPLRWAADAPNSASDSVGRVLQTRKDLSSENESLREQLLTQEYQLQKLSHLTAENIRLNELQNASTRVDEKVVRVQLAGESIDPFAKRVLINRGRRDNVVIGQPVLDRYGLFGQVVEVEPFSSWVLLITDPQHSTPVQINRNGIRAVASGTQDSLHLMTLANIPDTLDIRVGDELVTSGLGQRFPVGYPVGVVSDILHDPGQPFALITVQPMAQFDMSRNLLLVY